MGLQLPGVPISFSQIRNELNQEQLGANLALNGFEWVDSGGDALPDNWEGVNVTASINSSINGFTGNFLRINREAGNSADIAINTTGYTFPSGVKYKITFKYRSTKDIIISLYDQTLTSLQEQQLFISNTNVPLEATYTTGVLAVDTVLQFKADAPVEGVDFYEIDEIAVQEVLQDNTNIPTTYSMQDLFSKSIIGLFNSLYTSRQNLSVEKPTPATNTPFRMFEFYGYGFGIFQGLNRHYINNAPGDGSLGFRHHYVFNPKNFELFDFNASFKLTTSPTPVDITTLIGPDTSSPPASTIAALNANTLTYDEAFNGDGNISYSTYLTSREYRSFTWSFRNISNNSIVYNCEEFIKDNQYARVFIEDVTLTGNTFSFIYRLSKLTGSAITNNLTITRLSDSQIIPWSGPPTPTVSGANTPTFESEPNEAYEIFGNTRTSIDLCRIKIVVTR